MYYPDCLSIRVHGEDTITFLQQLLTCDVRNITEAPILTACCNIKGRIIANMMIQRADDDIVITLPTAMKALLLQHCQRYLFRSKVAFLDEPTLHSHYPAETIWILPETSGLFLPQSLGLEKGDGVSFKKGCYLGQEVIARTQHLGRLKRHAHRCHPINPAPNIGTTICDAAAQAVGTVAACWEQAMVIVIEDRAVTSDLFCNNQPIHIAD